MRCDDCDRRIDYSYYINNDLWLKATGGVKEGHICAHCILERLDGLDWHITWNEPLHIVMEGVRNNQHPSKEFYRRE